MPARKSTKTRINVLMMGAAPKDAEALRLGKQASLLKEELRSLRAPSFDLRIEPAWAVSPRKIQAEILNEQPKVLQFSGHGEPGRLFFESEDGTSASVEGDVVAQFLEGKSFLECVLLSACFSNVIAPFFAKHVNYVIACEGEVDDEASLEFTVAFYRSLAHQGDYELAFKEAVNHLKMIPELKDEAPKFMRIANGSKASEPSERPMAQRPANEVSAPDDTQPKRRSRATHGGAAKPKPELQPEQAHIASMHMTRDLNGHSVEFVWVAAGTYPCPDQHIERQVASGFWIMMQPTSLNDLVGEEAAHSLLIENLVVSGMVRPAPLRGYLLASEREWDKAWADGAIIPASGYEPLRTKWSPMRGDDQDAVLDEKIVRKSVNGASVARRYLHPNVLANKLPIRLVTREPRPHEISSQKQYRKPE